ncbi:hypothetical protein BOTCAL_0024g00040 [Botryotinia calthae]|uniref:Uncharacterized protein n=1 Tax=Botryotinia calthae TaxID=38488 RepID=A0A4Y8DGV9_9HELO|nr:hypothetical protein BOTCAL_0024g00040 [Botryotinia calthae]
MGLLEYFRRITQYPRHKNHTSHTQESSKSKTNKTHRSNVTNDGSSRGPPHDKQHVKETLLSQISEHRNGNSRQTNHVYKPSDSVKEDIKSIGKYIDRWNKRHPRQAPIRIDIIILEGLLNIDRNSTEPRSKSPIRFICKPEKHWDDLYTQELRSACKKLKWHTGDQWRPYDLDLGVRERLFKAIAKDDLVYTSDEEGMTIRRPPLEYRICQRLDLLRDYESKSEYDFKLKEIVKDIKKHIKSKKGQFEDMRPESKKGIITPRDLIKKWQKDYHFEFRNVLRWLKSDVQSCSVSHGEGKHGHATKKRVERSKSREHSGTESHESRRVNRPHDSAISLPATNKKSQSKLRAHDTSKYGSDSGTSTSKHQRRVNKPQDSAVSLLDTDRQASSKLRAREPSNYTSDSGTSTSTNSRRVNKPHDPAVSYSGIDQRAPSKSRAHNSSNSGLNSDTAIYQRKQAPSRSPVQYHLQTQSNHNTLENAASHTRLPLAIDPSSGYKRGRSPGGSAHSKSPRHTPRTPHTPRKSLPQSSKPSHHGHQKSPARPGSSDPRVTHKSSHSDLLNPYTSQTQSYPYPQMSQFQQHSNSKPYSPTNSDRKNGYPRPSHQKSVAISPIKPGEMSWKNHQSPEQIDEIHRTAAKELLLEEVYD